jgi:hypothetical protein
MPDDEHGFVLSLNRTDRQREQEEQGREETQ